MMLCDYCGEAIDGDTNVTVYVRGAYAVNEDTSRKLHGYLGHYHASVDRHCWWRIQDAIGLANAAGPTLESIPTISGQAVAARRRKHRKEDE